MLRTKCPFCGKEVIKEADKGIIVNGRGIYKTTILYHKSCYDIAVKYKIIYEKRSNNENK